MWYKYIREELIELGRILKQRCYWWVPINTAYVSIHIKGEIMRIKLPLPEIFANPKWHDEWKWKEHDDAEITRCKAIWRGLVTAIEEKLQRIDAGESTVEQEFKEGILFEDGKYGLKYKESWPI